MDAPFHHSALYGTERKVPAVADLTVDSDFDSGDEANTATHTAVVTSKASSPPSPRALVASHVTTFATSKPLSSYSGSGPTVDPTPSTQTEAHLTPTAADTTAMSRPPATAFTTASMGRRAPASTGNDRAQTAMTATLRGNTDAERGAKRRKMSITGGKAIVQNGVHVQAPERGGARQSSKNGATAPTPARASSTVAAPNGLRAKLNNTNAAPSVSFMNTALKPSASAIPVLDNMPAQPARPFFIGRLSNVNTATGLLSPGLTSPESVSAMVIDSDPWGSTNSSTESVMQDDLIIFLKEVKRLKWTEITKEYLKDYPHSNYGRIQSRYSSVLNKRNRTQDPPRLHLPSRFAAEATIDWASVHANTGVSRVRKDVADRGNIDSPRSTPGESPQAVPRAAQQVRDDRESSSGESSSKRQRSRRAAPVKYTWPQLRTMRGGFEELSNVEESTPGPKSNFGARNRSESPSDETPIITSSNRTLHSKPMTPDFRQQDAKLGLTLQRKTQSVRQEHMPYLSSSQRLAMDESNEQWMWDQGSIQKWRGAVLHVDFSPAELQTAESVVAKFIPSGRQTCHSTYRRHLRAILKDFPEPRIQKLAHEIGRHLRSRDVGSIKSFLEDAAAGKVADVPHLKNHLTDTLGPKSTWTGASSDIHTLAWSPDGQYFAAGAVAVTDSDSMQYNRPNVLMYGDTINNTIHELGKHCIDRPRTREGANSTHAMYDSQSPKLFTTVTSVAFSPSGRFMYSAGYDHSVCIWDASTGSRQPYMIRELQHKAPVDVLAVNPQLDGVIATATKRTTDKSIKLVKFSEEAIHDEPWHHTRSNFASKKAISRPDLKMSANALKFDMTGQLLLGGFGANVREDSGLDTSGDICLWDVHSETLLQLHGSSRNVFDVTFNPRPGYRGVFAVGCVANGKVNRGTRSVVRFYSPREDYKFTSPFELECKALDMNDVVWCPYDENFFAVGCTDGRSYLWDLRWVDKPLAILGHGSSLMPLQDGVPHERTDTGVRFLSWGQNARRLYSGSSDGVVKAWDVAQPQDDMFVKDLITTNSGIMSGAFTSDYSKLVLGEVSGTVNVLEVGRDDIALKDADKLAYQPYIGTDDEDAADDMIVDRPPPGSTDTAAVEASKWLETSQLQLAPMGGLPKQQVIQGPNYEGPFDRSEDVFTQSLREEAFQFQRNMAIPKGPQCDLPGCADTINTTTHEDAGDSGRSADRIPDELRRQWLDETFRIVPGKSKCTYCSRPAIPSLDADAAFCERHSFACLRCGSASYVTNSTSTLQCSSCGGIWDIGALGYECSQQPETTGDDLDVPALKNFGKESYLERLKDADTAFGDDMNALTDYYFGLAIDRPESPPL
ncbi:hypothetical protein E8E12_003532 [Didymella heteroderae]|uniref:WD40 repeat-like protein n=1 Tax=Didymella heteroderae TaxID=1769908 RepID=A0A9P5C289_9PLEO|nr:hypothetical protein E8E12_003532 [Didymella heteroderae]